MKFDYIEHTICTYYLSALINLDFSGLENKECELFENWYNSNLIYHSHFDVVKEEPFFGECEVSYLMGEVITIRQYFEHK
jgi:hypothetical protein